VFCANTGAASVSAKPMAKEKNGCVKVVNVMLLIMR
jgi:hypothetical protein